MAAEEPRVTTDGRWLGHPERNYCRAAVRAAWMGWQRHCTAACPRVDGRQWTIGLSRAAGCGGLNYGRVDQPVTDMTVYSGPAAVRSSGGAAVYFEIKGVFDLAALAEPQNREVC